MFKKLKLDWFLTGMFLAIALACLFPAPGAEGGWMQPQILTKLGIALIFFLNGAVPVSYTHLTLPTIYSV